MLPTLVREKERFPIFGLRNGIDRMFDDFFSSTSDWPALVEPRMAGPNVFLPPLDIKETEASFLVEVEVPGFKSGDVDVQIEDGVLVLRGERKQEKEEKTRRWHRSERFYGKFVRRILLPDYVDAEKVEASCKEGILSVTLLKKAGVKPKAISVQVK